jgi:L-fuconolactonase
VIVDAHAHVYEAVHGVTRDGPVRSFEPATFPVESLLAELSAAGVGGAVLLQGPVYGEANAYAAAACRSHLRQLAGQAYLDPWVDGAVDAFRAIEAAGDFRGIKLECSEPTGLLGLHPGRRLDEPGLDWLWDALEGRGRVLTLDLGNPGTSSYQTDAVRGIATGHPGLRIVVCHLGQPVAGIAHDLALLKAWQEQVSLAGLANVWLDCASLPAYFPGDRFPWPRAAAALRNGMEIAGPRKVLWGSDIPGMLTHGSYPRLLAYAQDALAQLSPTDRDRVFGGNALDVYFPG